MTIQRPGSFALAVAGAAARAATTASSSEARLIGSADARPSAFLVVFLSKASWAVTVAL